MFSPQKLVKYIVDLVEKNNSLELELKNLKEQNQRYKDKINKIQGEQAKPKFKKREPGGNKHLPKNKKELGESNSRKKNKKSSKMKRLKVTNEQDIHDSRIKRRKGYKEVVIQDLSFSTEVTRYRLECGYNENGEFGVGVLAFVKMLYYQCRVPMDKIHSVLKGFGIIIGKSVIVKMCHFLNDKMKKELDIARAISIKLSKFAQMDDTGAIVNNNNHHTFTLSTPHTTVLTTIDSKSMMSAMYAYTGGQRVFYVINTNFFRYLMKLLPDKKYQKYFRKFRRNRPYTEDEFKEVMKPYNTQKFFHRAYKMRLCALRAWIKTHPPTIPKAVLVSDAAGNFKFMGHNHQLCWIHEIRHYRKLEAFTEAHQQIKEKMLLILYDFYKNLKHFKLGKLTKTEIQADFNYITQLKTGFEALDALIIKTKKREHGLLTVLRYPFVPIHNNICEQDLRESVIKRKVSGGTRIPLGTYSWDVGLSLVHTCRKLKISFYDYLRDRYSKAYRIPKLNQIIEQMA